MKLLRLRRKLDVELVTAETFLRNLMTIPVVVGDNARRYLIEGAINDIWLAYCDFCREACFYSSMGTTTNGKVVLVSTIHPVCWERASYLSIAGAKNKNINPITINSEKWKEPTFGDSLKINGIINALAPLNATTLKQGLMSGANGPKHCQLVRNACAHKNNQTLKVVIDLATQYIAHPISSPSEVAAWRVPGTLDYAFSFWIDDMRANAAAAIM